MLLHLVNTAVAAGGQTVAGRVDLINYAIEVARPVAQHMQNRSEDLAFELAYGIQLVGARSEPEPLAHARRVRHPGNRPRLAFHAPGMLFKHFKLTLVDDRTDIGGQHARPAHDQFLHGAGQHLQHIVCNVLLQVEHAQRRTTLSGRQEGRMNHVSDHLFGQRRGVDDHRILTAGFGDQGCQRSFALGQGAVDDARGFGGAGESHACNARIGGQRSTHASVSRHQHKRFSRNTRAVEQFDNARSQQRRLLGRFGDRCVARNQSGSHLAGEDCHRKVPRTDTHEHALAVQRDLVVLTGGPGQHLGFGEMAPCHLRVVAAEISSLAHFVDPVDQRLAGFAHAQCHQLGPVFLEQVGHALQAFGALNARCCIPGRLRLDGGIHGAPGAFRVGHGNRADHVAAIGRRSDLHGFDRFQFRSADRARFPAAAAEPGHLRGQLALLGFGVEVDAP